jgi:peptidoglycan/xylan/chitin deacetylase (PgdA/CDA1 family)
MQGCGPAVSVVVPARNAEGTLARALESLLAQGERSFEAIVVENGSADRTIDVARSFARRDPRVRVEQRSAAGVSAARNAGIALARGEWLLFHDADDTLEAGALERLLSEARREPRPDAAVCGWLRVAPDGTRFDEFSWHEADEAFESLAVTCAFAIHCCLVRRDLVLAAGGFDESLTTCEDWDLWLRLARMGARFRSIPEPLARYHVHAGTASLDGRRMLVDGLEVIGRAHASDPRVEHPDPRYASGRDTSLLVPTRMACACFAAGLALGAGGDARGLLAELGDDRLRDLDPVTVAWCVYAAAPLAAARSPREWAEIWAQLEPGLGPFLAELEGRAAPGLARRARRELETLVLSRSGAPLPLTIGTRHAIRVELTEPIEPVSAGATVERLVCTVDHEGRRLGTLELPVCDGEVPGSVLADALAAEFFWPLLGRFLGLVPAEHDRTGWQRFLQELWGKPGWDEDRFHEPAASNGAPRRLTAAAGRVAVEVSEELPDLRVRGRALQVDVQVGGAPVGVVELRPGRRGVVRAQELRAGITAACGLELAVAFAREALIGRPLPAGVPLRELLQAAARLARARNGNRRLDGTLVLPRWPGPVRGPASRRAALPAAAAPVLAAVAEAPAKLLYDPAVQPAAAGRASRVKRSRRVKWPASNGAVTARLPILMYHRIAEDGPADLAQYRTVPAAFEEQLAHLRRAGYQSVSLDDWRRACERRRPLPGRVVLITFDDGYRDFADSAWPLLQRYGFGATVFLAAGEVGSTSRWDRDLGGEFPLLGWKEARRLRSRGVEFGSHTVTHPSLLELSNAEIVRECARSRAILAERLGAPPTAIAYPYGDADPAIAHLAGACGYTFGVTTEPRHARLIDPLLLMPRIEVAGGDTLEEFAEKLAG